MPETREYTVYKFEELSDAAKEKARDWYRKGIFTESYDWEYVYDDAERIGALIGIEINASRNNGTGKAIYFSGFSSQGDGACFEGSYTYKKGALKALQAEIGTESDEDKELIRIATKLQELQRRNFYRIECRMKQSGHYYHSGCMSVEHVGDNFSSDTDAEQEVTQLMRDFADWIYTCLEKEYEYKMSDEAVDESILANEYTFDEAGNRED